VELRGVDFCRVIQITFDRLVYENVCMITSLPRKRISAISQWKTFLRVLPTRWRRKPASIEITSLSPYVYVPSVLWRCWLGGRKGIRPVKNRVVGCWHGYVWSEVQTCIWPSWCHCHSLSLASVKSRLVLPFWYRLTQVVLDKGR